ncbi:MAG: AMP-binding protein [Gemmobacter sp.]
MPPAPDLLALIDDAATRWPDAPAVIAADGTTTFAALAAATRAPARVGEDGPVGRIAAALAGLRAGPAPRARGALALAGASGAAPVFFSAAGIVRHGAALAARLALTPADRIGASQGPGDPAFWAALAAAVVTGAAVAFDTDDAATTVAWLPAAPPPRRAALRLAVMPAAPEAMRALRRALSGVTVLNALPVAGTLGPVVVGDPRDPVRTVARTRGRPLAGCEVMIVEPGTGQDLPIDRQGEIWLRGAGVMIRADAHAPPPPGLEPDGFLRTGLVGSLDAEGRVVLRAA